MIQRVATVERAFELRAPSTLLLRFADGASLEVTAVHPLYAVGRGFTAAGELRIGDRVAEAKDGEAATLVSVVRLGTPKPVYNLTVGGTHTYFVRAGEDDLWAHNADECGPPKWREEPSSLEEQLVKQDAEAGGGEVIIPREKIGDPKYGGQFEKGGTTHELPPDNGRGGGNIDVHYMRNPETGEIIDVKFKNDPLP